MRCKVAVWVFVVGVSTVRIIVFPYANFYTAIICPFTITGNYVRLADLKVEYHQNHVVLLLIICYMLHSEAHFMQ